MSKLNSSYLKELVERKRQNKPKYQVGTQTGTSKTSDFKPTLKEFKNFYESVPSINFGYESVYDVNPKMTGVQQGPSELERSKQIQALPSDEQAKQQYIGKTFGTLPVIQGDALYLGYSPNRTWVGNGPYYQYDLPGEENLPLEERVQVKKLQSSPSYLYLLAPKNEKVMSTVDKPLSKYRHTSPEYGKQLVTNPEIVEYAKQKGIDLNDFSRRDYSDYEIRTKKDFFPKEKDLTARFPPWGANTFSESILASRDASQYPIGEATGGGTVIQDPTQFNLMGYLPIDLNLYQDWQDNDVKTNNYDLLKNKSYSTSINDPLLRQIYLNKAGVPNDANIRNNILFHTNAFPIQEYKPRKDAQGNIYKEGGVSTEGYKRNSPDVNNPYNIIPSNQITMNDVDFPVLGIDDLGNQIMMQPGEDYTFPGSYVTEFPMKNMGNKRFGQFGMEKSAILDPDIKPISEVVITGKRSKNKLRNFLPNPNPKIQTNPKEYISRKVKTIENDLFRKYIEPDIQQAYKIADRAGVGYGEHNGPIDAIRHATSASKIASSIPVLGMPLANILGAAHEISSPQGGSKELFSDLYNNFVGSVIGSVPFVSDDTRRRMVVEAQKRGILSTLQPQEKRSLTPQEKRSLTPQESRELLKEGGEISNFQVGGKKSVVLEPDFRSKSQITAAQQKTNNTVNQAAINARPINLFEGQTSPGVKALDAAAGVGDVITDVMQVGNFIPHPVAQGIGKAGNWLGATIDAYQAGRSAYEGDYGDAAINIGSAVLPSIIRNPNVLGGYSRSAKYNFGNRSKYLPVDRLYGRMTPRQLAGNRALLGTLGVQTAYDAGAFNNINTTGYNTMSGGPRDNTSLNQVIIQSPKNTGPVLKQGQKLMGVELGAKFQMGGTMSVPRVNGQVVSSGPQLLTSVKKTRGPITKNKKGDVKTMSNQQVKQVLKYSKQKPNKI